MIKYVDIFSKFGVLLVMVRTLKVSFCLLSLYLTLVKASVGDRLPEFKECVEVRETQDKIVIVPMTTSRLAHARTVRREMQYSVSYHSLCLRAIAYLVVPSYTSTITVMDLPIELRLHMSAHHNR